VTVAARWLKEQFFEVYLPRIRIERHVRQRHAEHLTPLFPGYLFISIVDRWCSITSTIGLVDVLRASDGPARVPDKIIADLKARERDCVIELPTRPLFQRGERVRIIRGALQGQIAIFQDMKPKERIEVLLNILGAERQLELARRDVLRAK
jgi:transcriptional antiterminator RfaH